MIHPQLKINDERLHADFEELAAIGATRYGGVNRLALSAEDMRARAWFADKIEEAGLLLRDDDAANLSGILPGSEAATRTLLIGSHLDSVPDGGKYDGSLGVLAGLECLRSIQEANMTLPVHLEVIDFTDDEGNWRSLFGVRALAGLLSPEDLRDHSQEDASFLATLLRAGINPSTVVNAKRDPASILNYIELHIEQGNRLERDDDAEIGVVSHIVGRTNYEIRFHGQAGHSGTTDMYRRRDALRGAALFITRAHDLVRERYGDGIFNCGNVDVLPGAFNVIPSNASLIFEVRHVDPALMAEMEIALVGLARECAATNALDVQIEMVFQRPAATMSDTVQAAISGACGQVGVGCLSLVSYSGHAAQVTSTFTDSGMIFIPSVDGVSHHPREFSRWTDVVNGANVLLQTILNLAQAADG
jgi:N-carbamoyl-L-amino-acid hydrolase